MARKRIFLFFMLALIIQETYSAECKPEENMTMEKKLTAKLLCNYNKDVRPVKKNTDSMEVTPEILILSIKTSYERASVDAITLYTMTVLEWTDEFLTWDPKEYDGIHDIMMESQSIWTPEISVINVNKQQRQYMTKPCSVYSSGHVYCYEKFSYSMSCSKTYKEWPYDTHNCSAVFGIWMQEKHSDIRFTDSEISIEGSQKVNKFWNLLSATIDTADETIKDLKHPRVRINLVIKRNSVVLEYEYLMPIYAMIIISISSLCLEIKSAERMILMVYNIFLHFRYLEHMGTFAPIIDADTPDAIIYIRDSLFLSCGILVAGMILINVSKQTSATPSWIKTVNDMMNSQIGKIIMYGDFEPTSTITPAVEEEDDAAKTEEKPTTDNGWQNFSLVLNRLVFICVCLIYVFLILRFLI